MKKVLGILLAVLFLAAGNAFAHCGKCGMGDEAEMDLSAIAEKKAGEMAKNLSLDDEQKNKIAPMIIEKMQRKRSLMEAKDKALDDIHANYEAKLKEVLNEEQFKKWESRKEGLGDKCPMCKDGKICKKCKEMKGKDGKCSECKDGKAFAKCEKMKKGDCPKCKDGKMCAQCEKMSEGKCPKCKDGKMCKMCKIKKAKDRKEKNDGHDYGKDSKK